MGIEIWVAIIAGATSLGGSFLGALLNSKLTTYKVEQLEKKMEKIDTIENNQIVIQGTLESFASNAGERRKMVEDLQQEVDELKASMNQIQTKIAILENQIQMFHSHDHS